MGTAPQKRSKIILNGKMRKEIWNIFNPLPSKIPLLWGRDVLHDMGAVLTMQPAHRMIILPYDQEQVSNLIRTFGDWSIFFFHVPLLVSLITIILKIKFVSFFKLHPVIFPSIVKTQPLSEARLVFTDGFLRDTLWSFQRARWRK